MSDKEQSQEQGPAAEISHEKGHERGFEDAWQPGLWSKIILLLLIVGYGIALVVANTSKVPISFLIKTVEVSKIWLILVSFVIGLLSGVIVSQMHRHNQIRRARLKELEKTGKET